MSYRHVWIRPEVISSSVFGRIVDDLKRVIEIFERNGIGIASWDGSGGPVIDDVGLRFNGARRSERDDSYEPFVFDRRHKPFPWDKPDANGCYVCFCATNYRGYNSAVESALIIAKHHLVGDLKVTSDGVDEDWLSSRRLCQTALGYGMDFRLHVPSTSVAERIGT